MLCQSQFRALMVRVSRLLAVFLAAHVRAAEEPAVRLCEPWKSAYLAHDATGGHVIGLWKFDGRKIEDASGHGHRPRSTSAKLSPDGRFGGCLECFHGPGLDKEHRATGAKPTRFEPQRAIHPGTVAQSEAGTERRVPPGVPVGQEVRRPCRLPDDSRSAGFERGEGLAGRGSVSAVIRKPGIPGPPSFRRDCGGTWPSRTTAKAKEVSISTELPWGSKRVAGRQAIAAGTHPLSIGDRIGSNYGGFPGFIDEVRIRNAALEFRPVRVERISDRACFRRLESPALLRFAVTNLEHRAAGRGGA